MIRCRVTSTSLFTAIIEGFSANEDVRYIPMCSSSFQVHLSVFSESQATHRLIDYSVMSARLNYIVSYKNSLHTPSSEIASVAVVACLTILVFPAEAYK